MKTAIAHFKRHIIEPDEQVIASVSAYTGRMMGNGKNAQRNGALLLTNSRLLFVHKGLLSSEARVMALTKITGRDGNEQFDITTVNFRASRGEKLTVKIPRDAEKFFAALDAQLARLSPSSDDQGEERIRRLERLTNLLEKGVLTEEEFQAEKKRVLGESPAIVSPEVIKAPRTSTSHRPVPEERSMSGTAKVAIAFFVFSVSAAALGGSGTSGGRSKPAKTAPATLEETAPEVSPWEVLNSASFSSSVNGRVRPRPGHVFLTHSYTVQNNTERTLIDPLLFLEVVDEDGTAYRNRNQTGDASYEMPIDPKSKQPTWVTFEVPTKVLRSPVLFRLPGPDGVDQYQRRVLPGEIQTQ